MTTQSARLRAKIELVLPAFHAVTRQLWVADGLRERYGEYLRLMHTVVRATVPIMEVALARAESLAPDDRVAAGVAHYLRKHMREEEGHDEWVRQDMTAIGHPAEAAIRQMPSPAVANLVGAQYYWVIHHHPVCLLGHIAVLEGYPPHPGLADLVVELTGFPSEGVRSIRRHAALDQRHRDELMAAIDALPLDRGHVAAMGLSALHSVQGLIPMFEDLLASPARRAEPAIAATG